MAHLARILHGIGIVALMLAAVPAGEARRPGQDDSTGTITTSARLVNSPVFLSECTFAIDQQAPNYLLRRVVIQNVQNISVTGYQLGWVVVYRDSQRTPEVFSQSNFNEIRIKPKGSLELGQPLGQADLTDGYSLAPPVPAAPDVKMVSFFVSKVRFADKTEFHENLKDVAAHERYLAFAPR